MYKYIEYSWYLYQYFSSFRGPIYTLLYSLQNCRLFYILYESEVPMTTIKDKWKKPSEILHWEPFFSIYNRKLKTAYWFINNTLNAFVAYETKSNGFAQ